MSALWLYNAEIDYRRERMAADFARNPAPGAPREGRRVTRRWTWLHRHAAAH